MDWGRLFFSAYGRIRRQEFWISFLVLMGVSLLIGWILPIWPIVLYCSVCTRTKRLHDMGRSGWLQIIPAITYTTAIFMSIYFLIGAIVAGTTFDDINEAIAATSVLFGVFTIIVTWCIAFLVDLGFLLWIGCAEGEKGDNKYGPEPFALGDTYPARA
jgi:uncharacterized membrane protein YhaH (DUF805 family)